VVNEDEYYVNILVHNVLGDIEVKDGIYGLDPVLGCGFADNRSADVTFRWFKDGKMISSDDSHRVVKVLDHPTFSTLNITKIGNE